MATTRLVSVLRRPLKKIGVAANRRLCWLVSFLAFVAIGLTYTSFQSQNNRNLDHSGPPDVKVVREIALLQSETAKNNVDSHDSYILSEQHGLDQNKNKLDTLRHYESLLRNGLKGIFKYGDKAIDVMPETTAHNQSRTFNQSSGDLSQQLKTLNAKGVHSTFLDNTSPEPLANLIINKSTVQETSVSNATGRPITKEFECPERMRITDSDLSWFHNSIAQKSGKYTISSDLIDDVLILTPISNVKRHLQKYFENICSLTYPHKHISIVFGEDSSSDQTLEAAEELAAEVRQYFKRIEVLKLKGSSAITSGNARHEISWQFTRRRHLAMARNQLLFRALRDEKWVLWIDSDVRHIPDDLVERLLWPGKGIVASNCLYRMDNGQTDTFDRNTWRETEASKRRLQHVPEDFLMLEGYEPTQRKFLNDLKEEGDLVRLDGVGGCVLIVEADHHRKGLVFPSFIFDHHVETEGMAKMAARMGIEMYGLPSVNVIHW